MPDRKFPLPKDDTDRWVLDNIAQVGWAVISIEEEDGIPPFAFSIGLFHSFSHPEFFIMGLSPEVAHSLINIMGEMVRNSRQFESGAQYDDIAERASLAFVEIAERHYRDYLGYARWFYQGSDFPVLQCIWPDKAGRFPWESDYDARYFPAQKILGPVAHLSEGWLFPDAPNLAVFTVRQILGDGQPILLVTHDDDGSWQFLTGEPCGMSDAMIVSLAIMVKHDPSVIELANLRHGWQARRSAPDQPWQRAAAKEPA